MKLKITYEHNLCYNYPTHISLREDITNIEQACSIYINRCVSAFYPPP